MGAAPGTPKAETDLLIRPLRAVETPVNESLTHRAGVAIDQRVVEIERTALGSSRHHPNRLPAASSRDEPASRPSEPSIPLP